MVGEILGIANTVLGLLNSNKSHDENNANLEAIKQQQKVSAAAQQAKNIYAEQASRGLAGYETMKADINNQLPTTLGEAQDWLSGGGVVDFLTKQSAAQNSQLRNLDMANEQARNANMDAYARYLGGPMAAMEANVLGNKTDIGLLQGQNEMNKNSLQNDFMTSLTGTAGKFLDGNWAKIIALLSGKGQAPIDFNSQRQDYGMGSSNFSTPDNRHYNVDE